MSNRRREIRAAIATALLNQTAAEARVYSSRTNTLTEDELPAIVVLSRSETITADGYPASGWNSSLRRNAAIVVEGIVQALEDVDDQLDDLAAEIEDVLEPFIIPGLESAELRLTDSEVDVNYEGSLPIGAVRLTYQVTYQTTYRDTPNPYVVDGDEPIERSGAYPGGRVTPDGQTGEACPILSPLLEINGMPQETVVITAPPPGPTVPSDAPRAYVHRQTTGSEIWVINHNLGYRPSVELFTSGGEEFDADVLHASDNMVVIHLTAPLTGTARLV